jgi:hypothetical protein
VAQKKGFKRGSVGLDRDVWPTGGGFLVVAGFAVNFGRDRHLRTIKLDDHYHIKDETFCP